MFKRILYMFLAVAVAFSAVVLPMSVNKPTASAEGEPDSYTHYVTISGFSNSISNLIVVFVVTFSSSSSSPVSSFDILSDYSPLICVSSTSSDVVHYPYSGLVGRSVTFDVEIGSTGSRGDFYFAVVNASLRFPSPPTTIVLLSCSLIDTVVPNSSGSDSGYDDGYADGYQSGLTAGQEQGYAEGYQSGLTAGQEQGYTNGYQSGLTAGQEQGYTNGYNVGYEEGYDLGYDLGYATTSDEVLENLFADRFAKLVSYPADRFPLVTTGVNLTTTTVTFNKFGISRTYTDCMLFDYVDGDDTTLNFVTVEFPLPTTIPHDSSLYLDGVLFSVSPRLDTIYVQYKDSEGNLQLLTSFVSNTPTVSRTFPVAFRLPVDVSSIYISCEQPIAVQDLDLYFALSDDVVYSSGYNVGVQDGRILGWDEAQVTVTQTSASYESGYQTGITEASDYTFFNMISAIIDVPIRAFTGLFNFEVFGVNLAPFFTALLTIALVCAVLKLVF